MLYEMTEEQLDTLLSSCRPTPVMLVGGVNIGASAQENANKAWARLSIAMGFDPMSVQPSPVHNNPRFFLATPTMHQEG